MSLRAGTRRGIAHGRSCLAISPSVRAGSPILGEAVARREGGEWLSSPTYSVATGVSSSTLLLVLYEHVT
jgi:hypothetical protein